MLHYIIDSVGKVGGEGRHVVLQPHAKNGIVAVLIRGLIEHFEQKPICPQQFVPVKTLSAIADVELAGRGEMLGCGIRDVLHVGDPRLDLLHIDVVRRVYVAHRHVTILARLRSLPNDAILIVEIAIQPFHVGVLFNGSLIWIRTIHYRQANGVAGAAHLRGCDVFVIFRLHTQRLVHGVSRNFVVLERSIEFIGRSEIEIAVDLVVQKISQARIFRRRHVMAHQATDAIARQSAIFEAEIVRIGFVDEVDLEILLGMFQRKRSLAHGAMTSHTNIDDVLPLGRIVIQKRQLAIELRIEHRVAARQSHWRPAPLAVRRNVDIRQHHHARSKSAFSIPAVAAQTLIRCDELRWSGGSRNDFVERLWWERKDVLLRRRRRSKQFHMWNRLQGQCGILRVGRNFAGVQRIGSAGTGATFPRHLGRRG